MITERYFAGMGSRYQRAARAIAKIIRQSSVAYSLEPVAFTCSIFKTLKAELVWHRDWHTRRHVEIALLQHINGFYNPRRTHSTLGWKSSVAFEQRAA